MDTMIGNSTSVAALAGQVRQIIADGGDEYRITAAVAAALRTTLDAGVDIPAVLRQPNPDHYVMYPLAIGDGDSFSIASAVWDVGQRTPIHDHGTWGVIGIVSGREHETRYRIPAAGAPVRIEDGVLDLGTVQVCCTSDQDVHEVAAAGDEPCVGIHIYGANIGTLPRHTYDKVTGQSRVFVSRWPAAGRPFPQEEAR